MNKKDKELSKKDNKSKNNIADNLKAFKSNRNIIVFIIFFLIATILWFLNALNKEFTTEVEIPVRYSNFPIKKEFLIRSPNSVKVTCSGHGYNILKIKLERFRIPIIINFNTHKLLESNYSENKYFIPTNILYNDITRRIGKNINLISVKPDTLFFNFIPFAEKKVPVKLNFDYKLKPAYLLYKNIKVIPDSVIIMGEETIINDINFIETEQKDLGIIEANNIYELSLKKIKNVNYNFNEVSVKFPVKKFVEDKLLMSINANNFPENHKVVFIPDKIKLIYQTPIEDYNSIDEKDFEVIADYNKRTNNIIKLKVISKNKHIINYRTQPQTINFLLEKE